MTVELHLAASPSWYYACGSLLVLCHTANFGPILYLVNTGPALPRLLTYIFNLCRGEQYGMICEINYHEFANSDHILMTTTSPQYLVTQQNTHFTFSLILKTVGVFWTARM